MPATLTYTDGLFTDPIPVTLPVLSAPFDGIVTNYMLTQEWMCNLEDFEPLPLDTPHPDASYAAFKLAHESEKRDLGGGKVQWTRTYLLLPTDYDEPRGTFAFTFPGFSGVIPNVGYVGLGGSDVGRLPLSATVPLKVSRAFYNTADPLNDIPILEKFTPYYVTPTVDQAYVGDANALYSATTPSRTDYDASVAAGDYIVAQDSTWKRWMGNFYIRETFYVKAR